MSQKSTTAINHAMTTASAVSMIGRVPLFGGASFFAMIVVWMETFNKGVHMSNYTWFMGTDKAVIYIAFIIGILFALLVTYILAFEDYKKKKDDALVQFDLRYIVSFIISAVLAGFVSYYIIFYGIDMFYRLPGEFAETETGETIYIVYAQFETFLVVCICFAVGAITAYVIDALVCHKVMDGTLTTLNNQAKKKIQMQGELFLKDPATQAKIKAKAEALGLTDEKLVQKLCIVVSGENDPGFANYVQNLKQQQQ